MCVNIDSGDGLKHDEHKTITKANTGQIITPCCQWITYARLSIHAHAHIHTHITDLLICYQGVAFIGNENTFVVFTIL